MYFSIMPYNNISVILLEGINLCRQHKSISKYQEKPLSNKSTTATWLGTIYQAITKKKLLNNFFNIDGGTIHLPNNSKNFRYYIYWRFFKWFNSINLKFHFESIHWHQSESWWEFYLCGHTFHWSRRRLFFHSTNYDLIICIIGTLYLL